MSSSDDLSNFAYSTDNFTVAQINDVVIPALIKRLSQAKSSIATTTTATNNNNDNDNNGSGHSIEEDYRKMEIQLEKLRKDIEYIRLAFTDFTNHVTSVEDNVAALFKALLQHTLDKSLNNLRATSRRPTFLIKQLQSKLWLLSEIVLKLKLQIPLTHKLSATDSDARKYTWVDVGADYDDLQVIDELPDLHFHPLFDKSFAFKDFRHVYDSLDVRTKLCLLCFALIPENEVVKKRFFVYWWVGEGLINSPLGSEEKTYEEMGDEIFEKLVKMGCVEAVNKKHRKVADSYKMNPFIRSAMIEFAKDAGFFDFDKKGNPTADFSKSYRACLVLNHRSQKLLRIGSELDQEKLQTIFNVNEPYPDFFELEWFSKLKNVKVLYLGRWQNSAKHHVEVNSIEFLKGLSSMKFLRFFSLRGIVNIRELPDSVCKLSSLIILDLRDCLDLEVLPDGIGSLKNLTHLDISECYLLDYMPRGIALLSELVVLKGFAIGKHISADSCTVGDLSGLRKLRKLSVHTKKKTFPTVVEVDSLQRFEKLQKLTILWRCKAHTHEDQHPAGPSRLRAGTKPHFARKLLKAAKFWHGPRPEIPEAFKELEKLDLQCYPYMSAPSWLIPDKLAKLKKLYIRGGELQNLGQFKENDKWKVEILRLKFLSNLEMEEMDLSELQASFPHLIYFEKVECPKLDQFPCDKNGLWLKP